VGEATKENGVRYEPTDSSAGWSSEESLQPIDAIRTGTGEDACLQRPQADLERIPQIMYTMRVNFIEKIPILP
jgi:hypothetical protein